MKVVLIDLPPALPEVNILSAGLGYLAGSLKAASHQVKVLDFFNNSSNIQERLTAALAEKPDIVGLSVGTSTIKNAIGFAETISKIARPSLLIAGGPHLCVDGLNFMKEHKVLDVGVIREGEHAIVELCDVVEGKKKLEDVKGIIFRKGDAVFQTQPREFIEDLDSLPYPDYTVFDSKYEDFPYSLSVNRGCPFGCYFCCVHAIMGKRVRHREADKVVAELKSIQHKYAYSGFVALGDNLTYDIEKAKRFCDFLADSNVHLEWEAVNVRADKVDSELLMKMKAVGCREVILGVESGDPEVLSFAGKGEALDDIERAINLSKAAGLSVGAHFIIGLPGSTYKSEMLSAKFAKRLKIDYSMFRHCFPFSQTKLFDWCKNNSHFPADYKNLLNWSKTPFFETDTFSEKERIKAYEMCNVLTRQYHNLIDSSVFGFGRMLRILFLLIKYDIVSLPKELFRFATRVFSKNFKFLLAYDKKIK